MSAHPYPIGTWVRGTERGKSFQGRVTFSDPRFPNWFRINDGTYRVSWVLESDLDDLPGWCFDDAAEGTTPAGAMSDGDRR